MPESGIMKVMARVPAKINIVLKVGPRRADGFHDLATLFHAVSLWDEVTASPADGFSIDVTGRHVAGVPTDETNLALRAAWLLAERANVTSGVHLRVRKEIPVAAGLAGGSADAAGALRACARLWGVALDDAALGDIAAEVGSDVPFALRGGTVIGEGRGERLRDLSATRRLHWVIVSTDEGMSTPEVYRRFDALSRPGAHSDVPDGAGGAPVVPESAIQAVVSGDPAAVAAVMSNDLQAAAISARPGLAATLEAGKDCGAVAGIVSGSGPTCVFLARDDVHAEALAAEFRRSGVGERVVPVSGPVATEVTSGA